jgi:hypothetical protein
MLKTKKQGSLLARLVFLTAVVVLVQWMFLGIHDYSTISNTSQELTHLWFKKIILFPLAQFFIAQLLTYCFFVYVVWFVCVSVGELFSLSWRALYCLSVIFWINSVILILALNLHYVPHSFFTILIRNHYLHDALTEAALNNTLLISGFIGLSGMMLAFVNLCRSVYKNQHLYRQWSMISLVFFLVIFTTGSKWLATHHTIVAANKMPNVFIISFDALRPDSLGFFNKNQKLTPHFDAFLKNSIVFPEAYTPLSRTFPSWVSLLTARYPLHDHARDNNVDMDQLLLSDTLPKRLQQAGYETVYASDDRRFNTVDQRFGFDRVVGPSGAVDDLLVGIFSDCPLSNLIATTQIGKALFPYNYANHGIPHTYDPDNFLEVLNQALNQQSNKPLFLAVHFDLSAWPFMWFNDKQAYNASNYASYQNAVTANDYLLATFLKQLEQKGLLTHAIVVLMSDHGITLGLHDDRVVAEENYQGKKDNIKLRRYHYSAFPEMQALFGSKQFTMKTNDAAMYLVDGKLYTKFTFKNYGLDTSFGYGDDVLSLKQNHPLLAFRGYGVDIGNAHSVQGRALLLDVAPTLLDLLHLKALTQSDGLSLQPFLANPQQSLIKDRAIYLESGLALSEIEQQHIVVESVIKAGMSYFYINPKNYLLTIAPLVMQTLLENKERAVLQGDWLLAYYPKSKRYKFKWMSQGGVKIDEYVIPPFFVLVNLKTGQWTQESDNRFFAASPANRLAAQLKQFYGKEMGSYQ